MNEDEEAPPSSPSPSSPSPDSGVGLQLSAAREKWGLSMQEVAQCLNLSVDAIKALEEGAYERLPGTTFAVGYIRAYAKLLKLDYEEIIASAHLADDPDAEIRVIGTPITRTTQRAGPAKRGGWFFRILLLAGVLALVGIVVSQVPGAGVNKILTTFGLSPAVIHELKSTVLPQATPPPASDQSGDPLQAENEAE